MSTTFLKLKNGGWLNADSIEVINGETGEAFTRDAEGGRYCLIEDWNDPMEQVSVGSDPRDLLDMLDSIVLRLQNINDTLMEIQSK